MNVNYLKFYGLALLLIAVLMTVPSVHAQDGWLEKGWWRAEGALATGVHSGDVSRSGDRQYTLSLEYEVPIASRFTMGLRIMPLFVHEEKSRTTFEEGQARRGSGDTIFGGGLGLLPRYYFFSNSYRGLFAEINGHLLGHKNKFEGNGSSINFLIGGGAGYKFKNGWHVTLKYDHISNANFSEPNQSVNTAGLGVGYSF